VRLRGQAAGARAIRTEFCPRVVERASRELQGWSVGSWRSSVLQDETASADQWPPSVAGSTDFASGSACDTHLTLRSEANASMRRMMSG
jgi:hypothetical protein